MSYLERAHGHICAEILEGSYEIPLREVLEDQFDMDELARVYVEKKSLDAIATFFEAVEKAVANYVTETLSAEVSELAATLREDDEAEAAEARAAARKVA